MKMWRNSHNTGNWVESEEGDFPSSEKPIGPERWNDWEVLWLHQKMAPKCQCSEVGLVEGDWIMGVLHPSVNKSTDKFLARYAVSRWDPVRRSRSLGTWVGRVYSRPRDLHLPLCLSSSSAGSGCHELSGLPPPCPSIMIPLPWSQLTRTEMSETTK